MIFPNVLVAIGLLLSAPVAAGPALPASARSPFLDPAGGGLVRNARPYHRWLAEGERAFLIMDEPSGQHLTLIAARTGAAEWTLPLDRVADALAAQGVAPPDAGFFRSPQFDVGADGGSIVAEAGGKRITCSAPQLACQSAPLASEPARGGLVSPDQRSRLERCGHDICLVDLASGTRRQLTSDGLADHGYAIDTPTSPFMLDQLRRGRGEQTPVIARWSPDSRRILVSRIDNRAVPNRTLSQFAPADQLLPREARHPQAWFIDEARPLEQLYLVEVESGAVRPLLEAPVPLALASEISAGRIEWAADSSAILYLSIPPGRRSAELRRIPVSAGQPQSLLREKDANPLSPAKHMLANGDFLWISERDGYRHVYLLGADGRPKRQVTKGRYVVNRILAVKGRQLFAEVTQWPDSMDPLHRQLIRADVDRGGVVRLSAVDADYRLAGPDPRPQNFGDSRLVTREASLSPTGSHFIATRSTPTEPPVTVLVDTANRSERVLVAADISALQARGFLPPERVRVLAADGKTPLFGTIHRPTDFRPGRRYPVIEYVYTGGQISHATPDFMNLFGDHHQALADLGYIVVLLDGRMTANRDYAFRWPAAAERERDMLNDHVTGLRQLAARYPEMDLDRLGVFGLSAGGGATVAALLNHPDLYKVGVALGGSYDNRTLVPGPGEAQAGCAPPAEACENGLDFYTLAPLAGRLKGRLFLIASDVDEIVPLTVTMQLVRAFIDADKRVDMFLVPNLGHLEIMGSPYVAGLIQSYFLTHLPPADAGAQGKQP